MQGVSQPSSINPLHAKGLHRGRRKKRSAQDYAAGVLSGDRVVLGQAITLIESTNAEHRKLAEEIIEKCLAHTGKSIRIGITGVPGVGKSTFIESFGIYLISQGRKLAVLAVDPSSSRSKGSILGDKVRMESLATNPNAFIRPSPSGGSLGGVAQKTRETILLCEAAGYDTILIETVGVGQSEVAVHSMVDFFLLLLLAGAGDELQGIKRGIMEMADAIAITKADGENADRARRARSEFEYAMRYFPTANSGWKPQVLTCSALTKEGLADVWKSIQAHHRLMVDRGLFDARRQNQTKTWMHETIEAFLKERFYRNANVKEALQGVETRVLTGDLPPLAAARQLLELYNLPAKD
ncbi:LAO/AO transport system ATPase [Chloroherpeton thalassium ATCC 35110]|uniref:LAO/AO transport system ATPase n=1 Tax=Chloroherpeton thalassium (strain ATCC 35110 / GB-78) TaxID=517418 RepID=B3QZA0_CHLT3|nr:methylmalonyl Co-A mutase-associated GTPase MeaB [Chloroherpeton thalassium]ACF13793.1 LAO/AO transport system ATPase [Chloroherpeton thalassium ATCC 35110]